jgi:hypothetical protein
MHQYARHAGGPANANLAATQFQDLAAGSEKTEKMKRWTPGTRPKAERPKRRGAKHPTLLLLLARGIALAVLGVAVLWVLNEFT